MSSEIHDGLLNSLVWIVKTTIILHLESVAVGDLRSGNGMQKWHYLYIYICIYIYISKHRKISKLYQYLCGAEWSGHVACPQFGVRPPRFSGSSVSCGPSSESSACSQYISNKLPPALQTATWSCRKYLQAPKEIEGME